MPFFMLSPKVETREIDLTQIIPSVATAIGAIAGDFQWGPVGDIIPISNKDVLVKTFGKPHDENFQDFFSAHSYLNYSNSLRVVRVEQDDAANATAGATASPINPILIRSNQDFEEQNNGLEGSITTFDPADGYFAARYPGSLGNSLKISYCFADEHSFEHWGSGSVPYNQYFSSAPGTSEYCKKFGVYNDEIHFLVIDEDGLFTGTPGTILERYEYASICPEAKNTDGTSSYIVNQLRDRSNYIYYLNADPVFSASNVGKTIEWIKTNTSPVSGGDYVYFDNSTSPVVAQNDYSFEHGAIGSASDVDKKMQGMNLFRNTTEVDVTLLITGKIPSNFSDAIALCNFVIQLAEERKDSIALVSPPTYGAFGSVFYNLPQQSIDFTNEITSSSYGVIDSCAVKIYDEYNAVYRWIPANGIVAGLCANTDAVAEPWYSPAGYSRGQLKNIVKISYNPDQFGRDDLYQARINPIVQFPGEGTVLYGDKTLLARPSAFDRINVRRLFNVLEKSISTMAKFMLFEFNDEFTRARFVNIVEPYLRDVKARRGIYDFKVVCDATNNSQIIIDSNEFVGDIYIQPARSINFIRLNFIATPTGANFEEIVTGSGSGF